MQKTSPNVLIRVVALNLQTIIHRVTMSQWKFVTNITEYNRRRMVEELTISSKFERLSWRKAAAFDSSRLSDHQSRRQLTKIVQSSRAALSDEKFTEVTDSFKLLSSLLLGGRPSAKWIDDLIKITGTPWMQTALAGPSEFF